MLHKLQAYRKTAADRSTPTWISACPRTRVTTA